MPVAAARSPNRARSCHEPAARECFSTCDGERGTAQVAAAPEGAVGHDVHELQPRNAACGACTTRGGTAPAV
eukprot:923217-Prymnesium_polylepis.1